MPAYDMLTQGLAKTTVKASKPAENFTWGQKVLFGNPSVGTDQDYINYDAEIGKISVPDEAVKGLDPTRINYGVAFESKLIKAQYFFPEDSVDLSSATNRLFGEPLDQPWTTERRELELVAKKRDAIAQGFKVKKEQLAFDCALNGQFTTRDGGVQSFPMSASLLAISGANLISNPFAAINAAAKTLIEEGIILKRIVLNPTDGAALAGSTAWQTLLDKKKVLVGELAPKTVDVNGYSIMGTINGLICGPVEIAVYAGFYTDASGVKQNYLPKGKALLLPADPIGCFGYTGLLENRGDVQGKVAMEEKYTVYGKSKGDLVTTYVQGQTAPAPLITAIDGYGVMTGIVAS